MNSELQQALSNAITKATGSSFKISHSQPKSGGCINEAWVVSSASETYFVKLNSASALSMFEAEAEALRELRAAEAITIPQPLTQGIAAGQSFLILEALPFGSPQQGSWKAMGRALAQLHRKTTDHYGWHRDNVIGSTPQRNEWTNDWPGFFREQRLRPQLELAGQNGYRLEQTEALLDQVEPLLTEHTLTPSLLHGDLWSGNVGFLNDGTPVLFDPATYYGDRETDLAFSEFFGGFPPLFYEAYQSEWPLREGYEQRKELYNLYHALNHLNLFGTGYLSQTNLIIGSILHIK